MAQIASKINAMTIPEAQYIIAAMGDIKADLAEIKKEQKELGSKIQTLSIEIAVMKTKAAIYSGVASFVIVSAWSIIQPYFMQK